MISSSQTAEAGWMPAVIRLNRPNRLSPRTALESGWLLVERCHVPALPGDVSSVRVKIEGKLTETDAIEVLRKHYDSGHGRPGDLIQNV